MLVQESTLFLWFMLSVHISVLMSVSCACVNWLDMFIHVVMSLTAAAGDRHMLPSDLAVSLWRMVSLELPGQPFQTLLLFPPLSPYLTQDFLFVCVDKNSPVESLLIFVF